MLALQLLAIHELPWFGVRSGFGNRLERNYLLNNIFLIKVLEPRLKLCWVEREWAELCYAKNGIMRIRRLAKIGGVKPVRGVGQRRGLGGPEPQSLPDRGAGRRGGPAAPLFNVFEMFHTSETLLWISNKNVLRCETGRGEPAAPLFNVFCDWCESQWFWSKYLFGHSVFRRTWWCFPIVTPISVRMFTIWQKTNL